MKNENTITISENGGWKSYPLKLTARRANSLKTGKSISIRKKGYAGYKFYINIWEGGNIYISSCGNLPPNYGRWEWSKPVSLEREKK